VKSIKKVKLTWPFQEENHNLQSYPFCTSTEALRCYCSWWARSNTIWSLWIKWDVGPRRKKQKIEEDYA